MESIKILVLYFFVLAFFGLFITASMGVKAGCLFAVVTLGVAGLYLWNK